MRLRPYTREDKESCLSMFDSNIPDFFAPYERAEFAAFLNEPGDSYWVVEEDDGNVVGCSGCWRVPNEPVAIITWTLVARAWHGRGVGRWLLLTCLHDICRTPEVQIVTLETSQYITGFYERVGRFRVHEVTEDGYEPGLHKVKMRREVAPGDCEAIAQQLATVRAR